MAAAPNSPPTLVTILTGFLGSGKTTLILNLLPQLPPTYKVCLLKNEFGDVAVDSQLASQQAVSGVTEMLNGCICCNLTGQLGDALAELRQKYRPDRILIETSGSAFPATLAMEVNRLSREGQDSEDKGGSRYALDGVVSVIDVENWQGYEDTSVTAKLQAQFTDLVVFNKWEDAGERRFDDCLDRLGDLEVQTPWVKSDKGRIAADVILGIDGALAKKLGTEEGTHGHSHDHGHSEEVEVLSITLQASEEEAESSGRVIDAARLRSLLQSAPRDEIYRIKGVVSAREQLLSSDSSGAQKKASPADAIVRYILNWAFGRWTFTPLDDQPADGDAVARLTVITARYESTKWKKRIEADQLVALAGSSDGSLSVTKVG